MESATQKRTVYKCDEAIRAKLIELREQPGWSNNTIARRLGVNVAVVSQYLSEHGCLYPGDVAKLERSINDLLDNEARRRASGVETTDCDFATEIRTAFEFIRKTNGIGAVVAESGEGKTRGIEQYLKDHPLAIYRRTTVWSSDVHSVEAEMFEIAGRKNYDGRTKRVLNTVHNLRGSDRLIITDDAHKLTVPALQWWFDFADATQCPVCLIGTFTLLEKLRADPQRFSRVGLFFEITNSKTDKVDRELIKHLIKQVMPNAGGEMEELTDLAEQVAREHGHYRSVHQQLKVAVEIKAGKKSVSHADAFRAAHAMLIRDYKLN